MRDISTQYIQYTLWGALMLLAGFSAFAQPAPADSLNETDLETVVITGQHSARKADQSTYRVQILDKKQWEAQGANTLADIMAAQLGVNTFEDPVLGTSVQMLGTSGQSVKIMIDGVPMIGRQDGELDLSQIQLDQIERIEVIEGPMAVEYGANALAGVINLITRKESKYPWEAQLSIYEGTAQSFPQYSMNEGTHRYHGNMAWRTGRHQLQLSGGRAYFGGIRPNETTRFRSWSPKRQVNGTANYGYKGKKWQLQASSSVFDERLIRMDSASGVYVPRARDERYDTRRQLHQLSATVQPSKRLHFQTTAAYTAYRRLKNTFQVDLVTLEKLEVAGGATTESFDAKSWRGQLSWQAKPNRLSLQAGYDLRMDQAWGDKVLAGKQGLNDYAFFASAEYKPTKAITFRPGLRGAINSAYPAPITPSIHLKINPFPYWAFRFSYAEGFRAPSLKELYLEFIDVNHYIIGNPDLRPESSQNVQASANWKKLIGKQLIAVEIAGFYNAVNDQIALSATGDNQTIFSYINIDKHRSLGTQLKLRYRKGSLQAQVGTALIGRFNDLNGVESAIASRYNYALNTTAQLDYVWKQPRLTFSVNYKYAGPVEGFTNIGDLDAAEIIPTRISGYQLANVSVGRSWFEGLLSLRLGVRNVFNVTDVAATARSSAHSGGSGQASIGTGRNIFLRMDIRMKK